MDSNDGTTLKTLYVAFQDDTKDPTYASAEDAVLVLGSVDVSQNPCDTTNPHLRSVPVIPVTPSEVRLFASFLGWGVREENGKLVLDTFIKED